MNKYERMNFQKKAAKRYSSTEIAVIKLYKDVINHLAVFCKDIGAKNVSDVFNVFSVLAHEGYLSYNKTIMTGSKGYFNIFPYDGADLLIGRGNCLHFSNFLKCLYERMGNETYILANYLYGARDSNFNEFSRIVQKIFRFNHACCLVIEDNLPYIYDSANVEAYLYGGNKYQFGNHGGKLRVNFDKTYLLNDITLEQISRIKTYPSLYKFIDEEKRQDIEKSYDKINSTIFQRLDQTDCMDKFHESIKPYLIKVKKLQNY